MPDASNLFDYNRYMYARGNPMRYTDPTGHCVEPVSGVICVLAVVGAAFLLQGDDTTYQPTQADINAQRVGGSMLTAAAGLLGLNALFGSSAAAVGTTTATTACADGDCNNEVSLGLNSFKRAADFGINSYNNLREAVGKGSDLQVHHVIEQRFSGILGWNSNDMPSVVLTQEEHQAFTNAWRQAIGYVNSSNPLKTTTVTKEQIWSTAQNIYAKYPELLEAAKQTIFGNDQTK